MSLLKLAKQEKLRPINEERLKKVGGKGKDMTEEVALVKLNRDRDNWKEENPMGSGNKINE